MGSVYEQFESELDRWRSTYATRPRRLMIRLFLLALEREEIVSVGYREELIANRLKTVPISEEEREIIRHALLWTWKDEEMHAIYIRGAILKIGSFPLRVRAFLTQVAGALGGWSTSVRQHVRWSDAPVSRALATLITWTGLITGKVPRDVREHIRYRSFRDFCLFNQVLRKYGWNRFILRNFPRLVFQRSEKTFLPRGIKLRAELRADLWESFRRPEVRNFIARLCAGYQGTLDRLPELYQTIACPTLVLWGEGDQHFPSAHAKRLHAAIPGSSLQIIPGAQHWMAWYLADVVAQSITGFIDGN